LRGLSGYAASGRSFEARCRSHASAISGLYRTSFPLERFCESGSDPPPIHSVQRAIDETHFGHWKTYDRDWRPKPPKEAGFLPSSPAPQTASPHVTSRHCRKFPGYGKHDRKRVEWLADDAVWCELVFGKRFAENRENTGKFREISASKGRSHPIFLGQNSALHRKFPTPQNRESFLSIRERL
jgi:hypothetical protein